MCKKDKEHLFSIAEVIETNIQTINAAKLTTFTINQCMIFD